MPRTLDPTLSAAMTAGGFTPYFKVQLLDSDRATVLYEITDVVGFVMDGLTCRVEFIDPNYISSFSTFRLVRGIDILGTPNTITSCQFYPRIDLIENRIRTLEGHVFPNAFYSTPGDVTYHSLIDTVCGHFGLTPVWEAPGAAWESYMFYPAGRTMVLNDAKDFFTFLRQKYLVFATDYDNDQLFIHQQTSTVPSYPGDYYSIQAGLVIFPGIGTLKQKTFLSRDEAMTVHYSGGTDKPIHNLGYLHSTANHPSRYWWMDTNGWTMQRIAPHLKYLDFDNIYASYDGHTMALYPAKFREIFNKKKSPAWYWEAKYLDIFGTTEGGTLPSTLEAAAPYTPLKTGYFTKTLSAKDNNLQAAMETIDDHDHSGAAALDADDIPLTTGFFGGVLSAADDNVQHAMNTIDDHLHAGLYQPLDSDLTSLSALGTAADKMGYTTGAHTWTEADITAAGRALIDDANAAAQRLTLGLIAAGAGDIWVEKAGDTMAGELAMDVNCIMGLEVSLDDDKATSFTPSRAAGLALVQTTADATCAGLITWRTSAAVFCTGIALGTNLEVTTGALADAGGTDVKMTISAHTDGKIYVSNRRGGTRIVRILVVL